MTIRSELSIDDRLNQLSEQTLPEQTLPKQTETFWQEWLQGLTGPTPFPGSLTVAQSEPRFSQSSFSQQIVEIPQPQRDAISALTERQGLRLDILLYGVWGILLSRYSGETDVVFGVQVAESSYAAAKTAPQSLDNEPLDNEQESSSNAGKKTRAAKLAGGTSAPNWRDKWQGIDGNTVVDCASVDDNSNLCEPFAKLQGKRLISHQR